MYGSWDMVQNGRTNGRTDRWKKWKIEVGAALKKLKNPTLSIVNASPPDTEYLYYPLHVEGVTMKASLLPANIK